MGVSVRHNARLAAGVAFVAAVMTVAWFARALQTGSVVDWAWTVLLAAIGVLELLVVRDARAPLMLADEHGVRVRRGETWSGLQWHDIEHVEVRSPASWLRDGQIVVHPRTDGLEDPASAGSFVVPLALTTSVDYDGLTGDLVGDLDSLASGRVPVLVLTRVEPAQAADATRTDETGIDEPVDEHATQDEPVVEHAAQDEVVQDEVVEDEPVEDHRTEEEPAAAAPSRLSGLSGLSGLLSRLGERRAAREEASGSEDVDDAAAVHDVDAEHAADAAEEPAEVQTEFVLPRQYALGQEPREDEPVVIEIVHADPTPTEATAPAAEEQEPEVDPVEPARETRPAARAEVHRDSVRMLPTQPTGSDRPTVPAQRHTAPVLVARVDDLGATELTAPEHALIGPLVAAARHRARLSIDTLSDRTRIRPHVLERIEVDDFDACGGDFYARGHLRTLARVFGLDGDELVALFDEHYAHAEIEARQVFEAELASGIGGGVRAAHTGPRWSMLAACVVVLALVWGGAQLFNDTPQELVSPAPDVVAGLAGNSGGTQEATTTLAPLEVTATGASPQVVVRDRDSKILWAGKLADGQRQQVIGLAPFEVTASNGGAVKVSYLGKPKGTVGDTQAAGSRSFGSR